MGIMDIIKMTENPLVTVLGKIAKNAILKGLTPEDPEYFDYKIETIDDVLEKSVNELCRVIKDEAKDSSKKEFIPNFKLDSKYLDDGIFEEQKCEERKNDLKIESKYNYTYRF